MKRRRGGSRREGEKEKQRLSDACFRHVVDWGYHFWVGGVHHLLESLLPTALNPRGEQHRHVPIPRHLQTTSHHCYQQYMYGDITVSTIVTVRAYLVLGAANLACNQMCHLHMSVVYRGMQTVYNWV